jgi:hypothetical protein
MTKKAADKTAELIAAVGNLEAMNKHQRVLIDNQREFIEGEIKRFSGIVDDLEIANKKVALLAATLAQMQSAINFLAAERKAQVDIPVTTTYRQP